MTDADSLSGPGPGPSARPDQGKIQPLLDDAYGAVSRVLQRLGQEIVNRMWQAAVAASTCEGKLRGAYQAALDYADEVVGSIGSTKEAEAYGLLGAATEIAGRFGCVPPTGDEIALAASALPAPPAGMQPPPRPRPPLSPVPPTVAVGSPDGRMLPTIGIMPMIPGLPVPVLPPLMGQAKSMTVTGGADPLGKPGSLLCPDGSPYDASKGGCPGGGSLGPTPDGPSYSPVDPADPFAPTAPSPLPPAGIPPAAPKPGTEDPLPPYSYPPYDPYGPRPGPCPPPQQCPVTVVVNVPGCPPYVQPPSGTPAGPPSGPGGKPPPGGGYDPGQGPKTGPPITPPGDGPPEVYIQFDPDAPAGGIDIPPAEPPAAPPKPPPVEDVWDNEPIAPSSEAINWDNPEICANVEAAIASSVNWSTSFFDVRPGESIEQWRQRNQAAFDETLAPLPEFVRPLFAVPAGKLMEFGARMTRAQMVGGTGATPAGLAARGAQTTAGIGQKYLGAGFDASVTTLGYSANYVSPYILPSLDAIDNAYLGGSIGKGVWECWIRAQGSLPSPADSVLQAKRTKPNVADAISLFRRGVTDETGWKRQMRQAGVLSEQEAGQFYALSIFVPPPTDLIRFMVRDVFDADAVNRFSYDEGFQNKWTGQALAWGRAQGIDETQMRYYWRAHWRLPSPTQAYEMMQRLRPGRVPTPLETTRDDVKKLLEIDDVAPFWQDRMVEISYRLPRLVDIRHGLYNGAISEKECLELLLDYGYSPDIAPKVLEVMKQDAIKTFLNSKYTNQYTNDEITLDEYGTILQTLGISQEMFNRVIAAADALARQKRRRRCVMALRKRYFIGDVEDQPAIAALMSSGYDGNQATRMVDNWRCELSYKGRAPTALQICRWAQTGLIPLAAAVAKMRQLGYSDADTERILGECQLRSREKARAAEEARRRAEEARAKAEERKRESDRKAAQLAAERLAKGRSDAKRKSERVYVDLQKLGYLFSFLSGGADSEGDDAVRNFFVHLTQTLGFAPENAVDLIAETLGAAKRDKTDSPQQYIDDARDEADRDFGSRQGTPPDSE